MTPGPTLSDIVIEQRRRLLRLYVDASAIVKLLVEEDGSDEAALLAETVTETVSASIAYVEARSALGRAACDGRLPGWTPERRSDGARACLGKR